MPATGTRRRSARHATPRRRWPAIPEAGAIWHPSGNFGPRRDGLRPELIVLHYTAMSSAEAALERLCSPEHEVSSHYLIGRDGTLWQLVEEEARAWHAGGGNWCGRGDVNSRSIGIELDNSGIFPFSEPIMSRVCLLISDIQVRWAIPPEGVIAHSDFAPARKSDPGRRFDWGRLAREGLALGPVAPTAEEGATATDEAFLAAARRFGYPVEEGLVPVLDAFRQRFRPWARGALTGEDVAVLTALSR